MLLRVQERERIRIDKANRKQKEKRINAINKAKNHNDFIAIIIAIIIATVAHHLTLNQYTHT